MTLLLRVRRSPRGAATRLRVPLSLALIAAGLLAAPGAASAASWSAVGSLPAGAQSREPAVAVRPDAAGAAAVWVENDRVFASTIAGKGGWTAAQALSPAGTYATTPSVDYGTKGRIVVAWTQVDNMRQRVAVASRLTSGVWSPATFVSAADLYTRQVKAVIGQGGTADLAWVQSSTSGAAAVGTATAWIGSSAPTWKTAALSGSGSQIGTLALAVGRGGNDSVRAAWDDRTAVRTASRTATGTWGSTTSFEAGSGTKVAVDAKGRNVVAFLTADGITVKRRAPGAWPWTTTTAPGSEQFQNELGGQYDSDLSLHVRPDGTARVYFVQALFQGETYAYAVRRATLPLTGQGSVDTLSQNSQDQHSGLAAGIDAVGNDLAYWNAGPPYELTGLTSAGALAGPGVAVALAPPVIDAGGDGRAIVAWVTDEGVGYAIRR